MESCLLENCPWESFHLEKCSWESINNVKYRQNQAKMISLITKNFFALLLIFSLDLDCALKQANRDDKSLDSRPNVHRWQYLLEYINIALGLNYLLYSKLFWGLVLNCNYKLLYKYVDI